MTGFLHILLWSAVSLPMATACMTWQAKINGTVLTTTSDVSEPYGAGYDTGYPVDYRAWIVPKEILIDG